MESRPVLWYKDPDPLPLGLAAPVAKLMKNLKRRSSAEEHMTRMVKCVKLDKESEGLAHVPYPGELGRRIYAHVSERGVADVAPALNHVDQ